MKKAIACLLMLTLLLCACTPAAKQTEAAEQPAMAAAAETPTEEPAAEPASEPELVEPQPDYSERWRERPLPDRFDLRSVDTDGDGVGDRCYVMPIGIGTDPTAELVSYFVIVPPKPEITALTAENGALKLAVRDLSEIGASGYEAEYRLKDTDQWTAVPFAAGQTELTVKGLAAGEYEVRVRAFVDTTGAEKNFLIMDINYGEYSDAMTVAVR